jgi:hypothetical protein
MDGLVKLYSDLGKDFPLFFHLYRRIKKEQLSQQDIVNLVKGQQELKFLEKRVELIMNIYEANKYRLDNSNK